MQWLSFEADYVQTSVGSLRYWVLTGKLASRPEAIVFGKRATAERVLSVLDTALGDRPFITGDRYTIADISLFAHAHLAADAGLTTTALPNFEAWVDRVRSQDGFLGVIHPYSLAPGTGGLWRPHDQSLAAKRPYSVFRPEEFDLRRSGERHRYVFKRRAHEQPHDRWLRPDAVVTRLQLGPWSLSQRPK